MGHKINKCHRIMYLALEERGNFLVSYLQKNGISSDEKRLLIGDGSWLNKDNLSLLQSEVSEHKPNLCIIDTYAAFTNISDFNNYGEVCKAMQTLSLIARKADCHILIVHHKNKGEATGSKSVMGSQGFFASVDALLLLSGAEKEKNLDIQSRYAENKGVSFKMTPFELLDWQMTGQHRTCEEALLQAVTLAGIDGFEFRKFIGYGDKLIQAAKTSLIEKGLIETSGGKKNAPLLLHVKNSTSP